jgi:hypothetical protein
LETAPSRGSVLVDSARRARGAIFLAAAASLALARCDCGPPESFAVRPAGSPAPTPVAPPLEKRGPRAAPRDPATYEELVRALGRAGRPHSSKALLAVLSKRFASTLEETIVRNTLRFWNHVDRIARGVESGFEVEAVREDDQGRTQLPVRFKNGDRMTFLIVEEDGQVRVDRL